MPQNKEMDPVTRLCTEEAAKMIRELLKHPEHLDADMVAHLRTRWLNGRKCCSSGVSLQRRSHNRSLISGKTLSVSWN